MPNDNQSLYMSDLSINANHTEQAPKLTLENISGAKTFGTNLLED